MPIARDRRITTREEFEALPDLDGTRYQVLDGELFVTPATGVAHQSILMRLGARLLTYADQHRLGLITPGINLETGPRSYLVPDLAFIPSPRAARFLAPGTLWVDEPPDLVVEIVSPSSSGYDRIRKRRAYQEWGVPEYWIVDPEAGWVEVYRLAGGSSEPEVVTEALVWEPRPGVPPLELPLSDFLGPHAGAAGPDPAPEGGAGSS